MFRDVVYRIQNISFLELKTGKDKYFPLSLDEQTEFFNNEVESHINAAAKRTNDLDGVEKVSKVTYHLELGLDNLIGELLPREGFNAELREIPRRENKLFNRLSSLYFTSS